MEFQEALNYVQLVKTTTQDQPQLYQDFLKLLRNHAKYVFQHIVNRISGSMTPQQIFQQVQILFKDYPALITGISFLCICNR